MATAYTKCEERILLSRSSNDGRETPSYPGDRISRGAIHSAVSRDAVQGVNGAENGRTCESEDGLLVDYGKVGHALTQEKSLKGVGKSAEIEGRIPGKVEGERGQTRARAVGMEGWRTTDADRSTLSRAERRRLLKGDPFLTFVARPSPVACSDSQHGILLCSRIWRLPLNVLTSRLAGLFEACYSMLASQTWSIAVVNLLWVARTRTYLRVAQNPLDKAVTSHSK
eukprot:5870233-Pleurochrysis_carterae.AAC.1